MKIETERLIITEFTPDMAQAVHQNSLDEDTRRFLPDEVFETVEDAAETINFLISENWLQYIMLLKWFELCDFTRYDYHRDDTIELDVGNGVKRTINTEEYNRWMNETGKNPYYSTQGPIVNSTLFLMDNFMNRIATFNFEGCFITSLKNVDLDYSKTDSTELTASFTMSFYKYNVVSNSHEIKGFIPDGGVNLDDHDKLLVQGN